jgi:hypothetical protein
MRAMARIQKGEKSRGRSPSLASQSNAKGQQKNRPTDQKTRLFHEAPIIPLSAAAERMISEKTARNLTRAIAQKENFFAVSFARFG